MFWVSLLGLTVAVALFKLGSLTVWVAVLSAALKLAALVGLSLVAFAVWRFVMRT